jgi:hypothetical protein
VGGGGVIITRSAVHRPGPHPGAVNCGSLPDAVIVRRTVIVQSLPALTERLIWINVAQGMWKPAAR